MEKNKMLNNVVLVGRLTADPELKEIGKDGKVVNFSLAVQRNYKNADGEYETDFIQCSVWNNIAENMKEYVKKGDLIGVKGVLQSSSFEDKDGNKRYKTEVRAEKITFLSSKKEVEEDGKPKKSGK